MTLVDLMSRFSDDACEQENLKIIDTAHVVIILFLLIFTAGFMYHEGMKRGYTAGKHDGVCEVLKLQANAIKNPPEPPQNRVIAEGLTGILKLCEEEPKRPRKP